MNFLNGSSCKLSPGEPLPISLLDAYLSECTNLIKDVIWPCSIQWSWSLLTTVCKPWGLPNISNCFAWECAVYPPCGAQHLEVFTPLGALALLPYFHWTKCPPDRLFARWLKCWRFPGHWKPFVFGGNLGQPGRWIHGLFIVLMTEMGKIPSSCTTLVAI